jgi:MFS family permease
VIALSGDSMVVAARALRALVDGWIAVVLPLFVLALGYSHWEVGLIGSLTLLGSALATVAVGLVGHRIDTRELLQMACLLMIGTGLGFALSSSLWILLVLAFVGTLNPGSGDVSVFVPLEHARLAGDASDPVARTAAFSYYGLVGSVAAAGGAMLAPAVETFATAWPVETRLRLVFWVYAAVGVSLYFLYRFSLPRRAPAVAAHRVLHRSRRLVLHLAALFCIDSFAGGLVVNSMLVLWLVGRFGLSIEATATVFLVTGLLSAASQIAAAPLARRIGLIPTMVFTHLPANVCLIGAALVAQVEWAIALLCLRSATSNMDVPARSAYVMSVVPPEERSAASSFTALPRSLATVFGPGIAGAAFALGWWALPLLLCGVLKIAYDLLLFASFRHVPPNSN